MTVTAHGSCLVIGATGLIGRRLGLRLAARKIPWQGTFRGRAEPGLRQCDLTQPAQLAQVLSDARPRAVFHCANFAGGVDRCESHPREAAAFHLAATQSIGRWCRAHQATLVFFSTDYVFDGRQSSYREDDTPNPLNVYGKLKLQAEEWIRTQGFRHLIVRTTNVYGWDPESVTPNYLMHCHHAVNQGNPFRAPTYLWGTPTYVDDLAEAAAELYLSGAAGTFHIVGSSFLNRFDWARQACEALGWDASLVEAVEEPPASFVPRPMRSKLLTEKFTRSHHTVLHNLADGLTLMKQAMGVPLEQMRCRQTTLPTSR